MNQASSEMEASIQQLARGTETILYTIRGVLEHNVLFAGQDGVNDVAWPAEPQQIAEFNSFFILHAW
jgi:hypothetical protein